jgi:hypothetical protein
MRAARSASDRLRRSRMRGNLQFCAGPEQLAVGSRLNTTPTAPGASAEGDARSAGPRVVRRRLCMPGGAPSDRGRRIRSRAQSELRTHEGSRGARCHAARRSLLGPRLSGCGRSGHTDARMSRTFFEAVASEPLTEPRPRLGKAALRQARGRHACACCSSRRVLAGARGRVQTAVPASLPCRCSCGLPSCELVPTSLSPGAVLLSHSAAAAAAFAYVAVPECPCHWVASGRLGATCAVVAWT